LTGRNNLFPFRSLVHFDAPKPKHLAQMLSNFFSHKMCQYLTNRKCSLVQQHHITYQISHAIPALKKVGHGLSRKAL